MGLRRVFWLLIAGGLLAAGGARGEEGMWTFDNPPLPLLAERYDFEPDAGWLEHVRLASVRFMDGGSGSFVSPHGLVVTNHHVAAGQLQKLSTAEKNYMATGFYARELADEIECPDLEVNVLVSYEQVTERIRGAIAPDMQPAAALKARRAARARIEKQCQDETGLRCDVVSLYHGGQYWLYRSRKYTDVRLVFAPEAQAAFFGGDYDNFTYPRYALDAAFFRVYQDGRPLRSEHYLEFKPQGAARGELVFITGHPGRTDRLDTVRQLEYQRDRRYPRVLEYIDRVLAAMRDYGARGPEQKRRATMVELGFQNGKKALSGELRGLQQPELLADKRRAEAALRRAVAADDKLAAAYGGAWARIEGVYEKHGAELARRAYRSLAYASLARKAVTVVQYVTEIEKPDAERLDGYHDAELEELRFKLLSPAPIYTDLEAVMLETSLRFAADHLPAGDPWVEIIAAAGGPAAAAAAAMKHTRLDQAEQRRALIEGGREAVEGSDDPLIALARQWAPLLAAEERWRKDTVESRITPAREDIARARFAVHGSDAYPDATFTLRLTFGPVAGYPMNGTRAPHQTTLYGLYDRALGFDRRAPWNLPQRYRERRRRLKLDTQVDFVAECDIIGGNSGSPVIDRQARLVGVVFDGNIESLSNRFLFDAERSRAVAVSADYILEALERLYDATTLADEILRPGSAPRTEAAE